MMSADTLARVAGDSAGDRFWYAGATTQLKRVADHFKRDLRDVAAMAAILSPRTSVKRSMRVLGIHLLGIHLPRDVYTAKREALELYELSKVVRGFKVRGFWMNLMGNLEAVTLDTWMATALLGPGKTWPKRTSPVVMKAVSRVKEAASILGWAPAEVQAATWSSTYRKYKRSEPPKLLAADALGVDA